jgi:hypothetical protein
MFSYALAMVESDLSVIDEKIDDIIGCLVKGQPKSWVPQGNWQIGPLPSDPPVHQIMGANHAESMANAQAYYLKKKWGDGLPVIPATQEKVDWLMTGVDHDPGDVVGGGDGMIRTKNRVLTYELMAINSVMAGARPEYMPVIEALVTSYIDEFSNRLASSMSASPISIVNGPITDEIRLGNGFHLWGPDPKHPAGRIIARALWFIFQNLGGMLVGEGTIGQYGDLRPGLVFAENITGLPSGWTTYPQDYFERGKDTNCATFGMSSMGGFRCYVPRGGGGDTLEVELSECVDRIVSEIREEPYRRKLADSTGSRGILIWNAHLCRFYANSGWTKQQIKETLAERMWYCVEQVKYQSAIQSAYAADAEDVNDLDPLQKFYLYTDPDRFHFVCAGGDHTSQSRFMPGWSAYGCVDIAKPSNWGNLLDQAEDDLGPMPPKGEGGVDL